MTFSGNAGDEVLLEVSSSDFDPYLMSWTPAATPWRSGTTRPGRAPTSAWRSCCRPPVPTRSSSPVRCRARRAAGSRSPRPVRRRPRQVDRSGRPAHAGGHRYRRRGRHHHGHGRRLARPAHCGRPRAGGACHHWPSGGHHGRRRALPRAGLLDVPYRVRAWAFYQHAGSRVPAARHGIARATTPSWPPQAC